MKPKIKLLIDCHVFDGAMQGTTTYLQGIYEYLMQNSAFEFYLMAKDIKHLQTIFPNASNIFFIPLKSTNKFYRLLIEIPQIISRFKIDYAHFQYVVPPIKNCKYIVTLHDILFLDFPEYFPLSYRIKNEILFKNSAQKADILLTVSDYSKQRIEHHFKSKNIYITPNAVNPIYFKDYSKKSYQAMVLEKFGIKNYFLLVSRLEPRKNHHSALNIFIKYKYYENYQLVFVGKKDIENHEYNKIYNKLPAEIKEKIFWFTDINFNDLVLFYRGATLTMYPSFAEGFGIPPLEAIATETPTVCSNQTAMADFEKINFVGFDPANLNDFNQKIIKALSQSQEDLESQKMLVSKHYNWENSAKILMEAILSNNSE